LLIEKCVPTDLRFRRFSLFTFNATIRAHAVDEASIGEERAATVAIGTTHEFPANVMGWAATVKDLSHANAA
jgi:hypothetical protein